MPETTPLFADAIRGLKTLNSMRDKLNAAMADAKINASNTADRVIANRKYLDTTEFAHLVPDFDNHSMKDPEDFRAMVVLRAADAAAAEEKREQEAVAAGKAAKEAAEKREQAVAETVVDDLPFQEPEESPAPQESSASESLYSPEDLVNKFDKFLGVIKLSDRNKSMLKKWFQKFISWLDE
jgi:hypothetical protein